MNPYPGQPAIDEDTDDEMVGEVLSRRRALRRFGLVGGSALASGAALAQRGAPASGGGDTSAGTSGARGLPDCVVRPAMTEGPYWMDENLNCRDVRSDTHTKTLKAGLPLVLTFDVSRVGVGVCEPRSGVVVDIWHCDALGVYSDASGNGQTDTRGQNFLRGSQLTGKDGRASFTTIYPGWYSGRAVHIHYRLRTLRGSQVTGDFASQLLFEEGLNDEVHALAPYRSKGERDTLNSADMLYRNGGSQMLLKLKGDLKRGYTATFDVGLNIA